MIDASTQYRILMTNWVYFVGGGTEQQRANAGYCREKASRVENQVRLCFDLCTPFIAIQLGLM